MDISYIVGSRSYGLAIDDSDIDLIQTWDGSYKRFFGPSSKINLIKVNRKEALDRLMKPDHAYLQWWFPAEIIEKNELSEYMLHEREHFVKANVKFVYEGLFKYAEALRTYLDWLYPIFPKRLAYSTLYYAMLTNYAHGMPMEKAHRAMGELRDQLLAMRRFEMPLEEALPINEKWREQALKASGSYDTPCDEQYLSIVHSNISKMLGIV